MKKYATITTKRHGEEVYRVGIITKETNNGIWLTTLEGFNVIIYKSTIVKLDRGNI